ncbi:hypothetical protein BJX64DRAFT_284915 [Aspergillus heterothallicus]
MIPKAALKRSFDRSPDPHWNLPGSSPTTAATRTHIIRRPANNSKSQHERSRGSRNPRQSRQQRRSSERRATAVNTGSAKPARGSNSNMPERDHTEEETSSAGTRPGDLQTARNETSDDARDPNVGVITEDPKAETSAQQIHDLSEASGDLVEKADGTQHDGSNDSPNQHDQCESSTARTASPRDTRGTVKPPEIPQNPHHPTTSRVNSHSEPSRRKSRFSINPKRYRNGSLNKYTKSRIIRKGEIPIDSIPITFR